MRQILLVEPDVDALGQLAEKLRARGMSVLLADDIPTAIARARAQLPHIVFVAAAIAKRHELWEGLASETHLAGLPRVVLVRAPSAEGLPPDHATYDDLDRLVARALEVSPAMVAPETNQGEIRGDLQQVPLVDLLQLLAMNRRTGVLMVSTPFGAGELRMADGEVLDSVYRRLEGEKAFYRLLSEREGTFVFSPGSPPAMARVTRGTSALLMEAMRQKDEVDRLLGELGPASVAFIASGEPSEDDSMLSLDVLAALARPRSITELLDELPSPDLEVLQALGGCVERGLVRRVERGTEQEPLCPQEQLPGLRALVARLGHGGFSGAARIVVASTPPRLHAFNHSLLRIAGSTAPAEPPPTAPVPHDLALLRLGEGVELVVVGLPVVEAFSPVWSLALPGARALIRLDKAGSQVLEAVCSALEVRVVGALDLIPAFDELEPSLVAQLLRATIEQTTLS